MAKKNKTAIGALDSYTEALTTMRGVNQAFGKDLNGLSQKLRALDRNKVTLRIDTDNASAALEKARNQFDLTGKAADKAALRIATQKYDTVKRNLDLVSTSAGQVEKNMASMTGAIEKADNRAVKSSFGKNAVGDLVQSGLGQMVIDTASNAIGTVVTSGYGNATGNMVSGVVGGMASGALMGGTAVGVPGAVAGAVIGGVSGAINADLQNSKNQDNSKDQAFKAVVKDRYDSALKVQQDALVNGTSIAASREQDRLRFSTLLGGDDEANKFLSKIADFALDNPYDYNQLTTLSDTLLNYGYKQDEIFSLLTNVGDASAALGVGADVRDEFIETLAKMKLTGKVNQNDLEPFLKQGIDIWKYLSLAVGKTEEEVRNIVSKGQLPGKDAAEFISSGLGTKYLGGMQKKSRTYEGLQEELQEVQNSIDSTMGESFINKRKEEMKKQIQELKGKRGEKLKEAYSMIGEWRATLKNTEDESVWNAIDEAMGSNTYKNAESTQDRTAMERILAEAYAIGENKYQASAQFQEELESQKKTIKIIRDNQDLKSQYYTAGYELASEESKGMSDALNENIPRFITLAAGKIINEFLKKSNINLTTGETGGQTTRPSNKVQKSWEKAVGINRIPYNNYPALLHEDEQVLTGVEARSAEGYGSKVVITGNTFNVRQKSDIDAIASMILAKIQQAALITP